MVSNRKKMIREVFKTGFWKGKKWNCTIIKYFRVRKLPYLFMYLYLQLKIWSFQKMQSLLILKQIYIIFFIQKPSILIKWSFCLRICVSVCRQWKIKYIARRSLQLWFRINVNRSQCISYSKVLLYFLFYFLCYF